MIITKKSEEVRNFSKDKKGNKVDIPKQETNNASTEEDTSPKKPYKLTQFKSMRYTKSIHTAHPHSSLLRNSPLNAELLILYSLAKTRSSINEGRVSSPVEKPARGMEIEDPLDETSLLLINQDVTIDIPKKQIPEFISNSILLITE